MLYNEVNRAPSWIGSHVRTDHRMTKNSCNLFLGNQISNQSTDVS